MQHHIARRPAALTIACGLAPAADDRDISASLDRECEPFYIRRGEPMKLSQQLAALQRDCGHAGTLAREARCASGADHTNLVRARLLDASAVIHGMYTQLGKLKERVAKAEGIVAEMRADLLDGAPRELVGIVPSVPQADGAAADGD